MWPSWSQESCPCTGGPRVQPSLQSCEPTDTEILFYALIIVSSAVSVKELDKWAQTVVKVELRRAEELTAAWQPLNDANGVIALIKAAFSGEWRATEMDKVGVAIQAWDGDGQVDGITGKDLVSYIGKHPLGSIKNKKRGKSSAPKRWLSWSLVYVADLIRRHRSDLQRVLKLDVALEDAI